MFDPLTIGWVCRSLDAKQNSCISGLNIYTGIIINIIIYRYYNWVQTILKQNTRRSPDHVNFKTFLYNSVQFKNVKFKKNIHCTTNSLGYELGWSCDKIPCTLRIFRRFYHVRKMFISLSLTFNIGIRVNVFNWYLRCKIFFGFRYIAIGVVIAIMKLVQWSMWHPGQIKSPHRFERFVVVFLFKKVI